MSMDCHARFRTDAHQTVVPRFNERFILSLSHCNACLVLDDELNLLPLSSKGQCRGAHADASCSPDAVAAAVEAGETRGKELAALVRSLADAQPAGTLAGMCKTLDQVHSSSSLNSGCVDTRRNRNNTYHHNHHAARLDDRHTLRDLSDVRFC